MDIKRKRRRILILTLLFFVVYIIIATYFFMVVKGYAYLGIRAKQVDGEWIVKRLQYGGIAEKEGILKGDIVVKIDGIAADENKLLNRWLVVEKAHSITIERNGKEQKILFRTENDLLKEYIPFLISGLIGFMFLFCFAKKQNGGRSEKYFYSFLLCVLFALLAIVPSSIGDSLGRIMIVTFISSFPFYLELFLRKTNTSKNESKRRILSIISLCIAICNVVMSIIMSVTILPDIFAGYLAQGVFSVLGILLILILLKNLFCRRFRGNQNKSSIDLAVISVLSFIPLILCYIFPIKWVVPFYLVIPFTLLPAVSILHSLIISKLVSYRYSLSDRAVYLTINAILSVIIILVILLAEYVPIYVLGIYTFLLIYSLLPYVEETLITMKKRTDSTNSLALFSAVENERENISIYIHDSIIQDVIYSKKMIENGAELVSKQEVARVLDEVVFYLRELCSDIYPLMIQEIGLKNTLDAIINQIQKKHPVMIEFYMEMENPKFLPQKSNFVLRSIRELINNSILHGNATKITLEIAENNEKCHISVEDNGTFETKTEKYGSHFGLDIIKEKLLLLNGELEISLENGTFITIEIPFDEIGDEER